MYIRFQVFTAAYTELPVRRRASTTSVSVSVFPETFPNSRHFSCVSIFIHILLYRCGDRSDGGIHVFFFRTFRHMRAVASVVRAYYLRWFLLFALIFFFVCSEFQQYFAGVNWQVAKRTKVFVSKHVEASSGGRGQDKNQKKKNRPVEAKARNNSRDIYI